MDTSWRGRHPRHRESSFALLCYDVIDACARDAMRRREAAGARTKGQSSFSGSFLPYYPYLAVRLTRHAYKAVFIVVTGQRVALVRDLSRRGEVEREYSSRSQNINRSTCRRSVASVATQRETSARCMGSPVKDFATERERVIRWKLSRHHFTFVTSLCCNSIKILIFNCHWLPFGNALLRKRKSRSERLKLFTNVYVISNTIFSKFIIVEW